MSRASGTIGLRPCYRITTEMSFTKFASFEDAEVLEVKGSPSRRRTATLDKLSDFHDYRTDDGYMYVRLRAISSRVNKNHDGWPSVELAGGSEVFDRHAKQSATGFTVEAADGDKQFGFATFIGKPNFIDHNNSDPSRARGVVVDSKLKVLPIEHTAASGDTYWGSESMDPEHAPPTEVELLLEIDAKTFPTYAKAVRSGDLDGFSMGCDVERSKCSHCGHVATNPDEYCSHIVMKGAHHDYKTADGKRISRKSYENCYGIHFFEISGVFDPADETALAREIRASVNDEGLGKTAENALPQSFLPSAPEDVDTMREEHACPICGETMEGETCDVCGYVEPPKGMDNPDLTKAQELQGDMAQGSEQEVQQDNALAQGAETPAAPSAEPAGHAPPKQEGSFLTARNSAASASVMGDMRWQPKLNPKVAARINQQERPIKTTTKPATNEPVTTTVVKNPAKPVTATMRTAQDLIEAANNNHQGDTMSTKIADGPTGPEASPDARVDATGVGGVIEPSNDAASKADAQVDVTSVGTTGVTDVDADKTESLPTASEGSDDAGFDATKTTEDSGPTATYGDSDGTEKGFTDGVTTDSLEGNQNKDSSVRQAYDAKPFYDQPGLSGGSTVKGVQPVAESFGERVDVLQPAATPENNSGPTSQWTGTEGNKVLRQQDPVTPESIATEGFTSHIIAAIKLTDLETELGMIGPDEKYNRIADLDAQDDEQITAQLDMLSRVKTAATQKLAKQRTAGVARMPSGFGQHTAGDRRMVDQDGHAFERVSSDESESVSVTDETLDSGLFTR